MADDPELAERVRHALRGERDVVEKRMFGSLGFMVGGALRVGVGTHRDHVMMVRVPKEEEQRVLDLPGANPAIMRGHRMSGWLFLDRRAVETDEQIAEWVALSMAAV